MKRFVWMLVLLSMAAPVWAAKKVTVQQLRDELVSLQQAKKTDVEVSSELKQLELTEALSRSVMNALAEFIPGPLSTEQIYVLEARSALLPPPAADLPTGAAPDAAAQKAILDKAAEYATKTYAALPHLSATKTTIRFQDNIEVVQASSGMHSSATTVDPNLVAASQFVHYINSTEMPVESRNGGEMASTEKDKTPWGQNGQVISLVPVPNLTTILQEAQASGKDSFLRWETVSGVKTAVFSFGVDKKKTHYTVSYCCFPDTEQAGVAHFTSAAAGSANGSGGGGAKGNFQTNTSYTKTFKSSTGYHGEVFIDPESGTVLRLITQAELKPSDVVHQEEILIDYGPAKVGDKMLIVPIKTITHSEVVPNGDTGAGKYSTRNTYLSAEYKDYQAR